MKKIFFATTASIALCATLFIVGCKKNSSDTPTTDAITASKTTAQKKDVVKFSYNKTTGGSTVRWSVTPSAGVRRVLDGNDVYFKFSNSGSYSIHARTGSGSSSADDSTTVVIGTGTGSGQDTTLPGGSTGTPVDSNANPCSASQQIFLPILPTAAAYDTIQIDSTLTTTRVIDVVIQATLSNSCQSFESVQQTNVSNLVHNLTVVGRELICPYVNCSQALSTATTVHRIQNAVVGTHTINFYQNGQLLLTKQVVVN